MGGQSLGKSLPRSKGQVAVFLFPVVVDGIPIAGGRVVEISVEVEIIPRLSAVVIQAIRLVKLLALLAPFLEGRIGLQLLLDARLQLQRGYLQQLHQLDLLGAQLLLEFLLEALLEHG